MADYDARSSSSSGGLPPLDGTETFIRAVVMAGDTQGNVVPKAAEMTTPGRQARLYAPASRVLTLADANGSIITTTLPTNTVLKLQTASMLDWTRDESDPQEIVYLLQRGWLGNLFVTPNQYLGEVASTAAMIALSAAEVGDWCQRSDDSHYPYQLTATPYSTAANWTKRDGANRPRIFFGATADQAAMVALSNALPGDWCTRTDASSAVYQLTASPYSTAANWVARTDDLAPTTPQVVINWNDLDPQYLAMEHPEVKLTTKDFYDYWVAS